MTARETVMLILMASVIFYVLGFSAARGATRIQRIMVPVPCPNRTVPA